MRTRHAQIKDVLPADLFTKEKNIRRSADPNPRAARKVTFSATHVFPQTETLPDFPEASRQYDAYAGRVYVMLMEEGTTSTAIAHYLYETSIGHIGLDPSEALKHEARRAADGIIAARPYFDLQ